MATKTSDILRRFKRTANRRFCPECSSLMTLVDWRKENGILFAWYGCSRSGCDGQWLEKTCSDRPDVLEKVC